MAVTQEGSKLIGDWQQPVNQWSDLPGSIHNDEVAHKVGMRGGTIPGTVHLDHFSPLAEELWGQRWRLEGGISMYYTFATTHMEDVRAFVNLDEEMVEEDNPLFDAWLENKDGRVVCKGSIGVGKAPASSYIRGLPLDNAERDQLKILAELQVGRDLDPVVFAPDGIDDVLAPSAIYHQLMMPFPRKSVAQPSVGFFGGTDLRLIRGPIRGGVNYVKKGKVVCVGASPKTEFAWIDSSLNDTDGNLIAEMRHMTRWMKVSSPLWQE